MNPTLRRHLLLGQKKFKNQYSYLLDGGNKRININAVGTALATTTKGTWSLWVKPVDATPIADQSFINFGNGDGTDSIPLYITSAGLLASLLTDGPNKWAVDTDNAVFSDNTWSYIALVQDGVSPVLYVNGVAPAQAFSVTTDKTFWFNNLVMNNGRIGCYSLGADELFFNGNIDEVGFFNTNLSSSQILEIYNNGKPKDLKKHSANANLVSYFRVDKDIWDGTNWTVVDSKGTNNGSSVNLEESDRELNDVP